MMNRGKMKKFAECQGRPSLLIPGDHLEYCDRFKYPVNIVWKRVKYADVTWLNEPFQVSHRELFHRDDFRQDLEERAEVIYLRYATPKTARAITYSFITLYELEQHSALEAAEALFDMTIAIIREYESAGAKQ